MDTEQLAVLFDGRPIVLLRCADGASHRFHEAAHRLPVGTIVSIVIGSDCVEAPPFEPGSEWAWMPGAALWSCGLDIDTRSFSYTIVLDVRSDDVRSFLHAVRVARHRRTASCEAPVATRHFTQSTTQFQSINHTIFFSRGLE